MAEARGGDGEPGAPGMGLELKLEPEGGGLEVKLELAGSVEAKLEWDGLQIQVEVMDEPEEVMLDGPAAKQELVEGKQDVKDEPEAKRGLTDGADVKQGLGDGVEVKGELTEEGDVKGEFLNGPEAMGQEAGRLQVKEEAPAWLEEGSPVMSPVDVMEEVSGGGKVEEEPTDGIKMQEGERVDGVQEEVKTDVKEENGTEVKIEVDGMEVKEEGPKEEAMDGAELLEDGELPREPRMGSKRKLAMSSCETCGTEEAKYRCPRCMKCSCSLACVKKHKTELTCNGIREKTAFVSLKQFTEINLLSDYRFLEDIGRSADYVARDIFLKRPSTNRILNYMKNRARRCNIDLRILPIGFTKRRENTTMFDRKEQRFYWHLKLLFPQSHAEYVEKGVPGDKKLHEILRTYIDPEKSDPVIRQRLKAYVFSESGVQILMKIENMQHNLVRYYELDPCKSLVENLKGKVVIEYPTLHVVLKGSKNDMIILGQERNESTESFGSENPVLSSEEEGEIQESS